MKCPHCGQEHPDTTKFCPETGKQMESQALFCSNPDCNFRQPLPLGTKFCPNCGRSLQDEHTSNDYTSSCRCPTDMSGYFKGSHQGVLETSKLDTTGVTNMASMFEGCDSITSLDLSKFDTSNVQNMEGMFSDCRSLRHIELSNFDTIKVKNLRGLFANCSSLESVDLSVWDTRNVDSIESMFWGCSKLKYLNLSRFELQNPNYYDSRNGIRDFSNLFFGCKNLEHIIMRDCSNGSVDSVHRALVECGLYNTSIYVNFPRDISTTPNWKTHNKIVRELSINDFFPIHNFTLGKTRISDIISRRPSIFDDGSVCALRNGIFLFSNGIHDFINYIYIDNFNECIWPDRWVKLGFTAEMTYENVIKFFSEANMSIQTHQMLSFQDDKFEHYDAYSIRVISHDQSILFDIQFDNNNDSYELKIKEFKIKCK